MLLMGLCCCAFAVLYLGWWTIFRGGELVQLVAAAFGDASLLPSLARRNLVRVAPIRFTVVVFFVEVALMGILAWAGCGLILFWRSARWAAVFYCGWAIAVALLHTFVRVFFLTLPGEVVMVSPFLMDAVLILFANVLAGTMFLPAVTEAYAGDLEAAPDAAQTANRQLSFPE
jgi:hypothetical protein